MWNVDILVWGNLIAHIGVAFSEYNSLCRNDRNASCDNLVYIT